MNPKIFHFITLIFAVAAAILADADKLQSISAINPKLAQLWPILLATATAVDRIGKLIAPSTSDKSPP